jgi:uncharacterized protein (TIGR02058 family)
MPAEEMLLETGMGVDLHGADATRAARRAVEDAVRRVSLLFLRALSRRRRTRVSVDVTIGVPDPETVDTAAVASALPVGRVSVRCRHGGLDVVAGGERVVLAVAAVIVRVEFDDGPETTP